MAISIDVEVDSAGIIHLPAGENLPEGRARLTWMSTEEWERLGWLKLSEASLAKDWLTPEEDEAWAHLQPSALEAAKQIRSTGPGASGAR